MLLKAKNLARFPVDFSQLLYISYFMLFLTIALSEELDTSQFLQLRSFFTKYHVHYETIIAFMGLSYIMEQHILFELDFVLISYQHSLSQPWTQLTEMG